MYEIRMKWLMLKNAYYSGRPSVEHILRVNLLAPAKFGMKQMNL